MTDIEVTVLNDKIVNIPRKYVSHFNTINLMMMDLECDEDTPVSIPVTNVEAHILEILIEFCGLIQDDNTVDVSAAYAFIEKNNPFLKRMIKTAFHLEFNLFMENAKKYMVAVLEAADGVDQARDRLHFPDDIPQEEKDQLTKELKFCKNRAT